MISNYVIPPDPAMVRYIDLSPRKTMSGGSANAVNHQRFARPDNFVALRPSSQTVFVINAVNKILVPKGPEHFIDSQREQTSRRNNDSPLFPGTTIYRGLRETQSLRMGLHVIAAYD